MLLKNHGLPADALAEAIGQIISIIFAFFTNKIWVFKHHSAHIFRDFINFTTGRLVLMFLSIFLNWWFGDVHPEYLMQTFHMSKDWSVLILSVIIQIVIIILNYLYSKFLVFRKPKNKEANP